MNKKLLETVGDICYIAGETKTFSGNSRTDINEFIHWAKEFEKINSQTDWDQKDYSEEITDFAIEKIKGFKATLEEFKDFNVF